MSLAVGQRVRVTEKFTPCEGWAVGKTGVVTDVAPEPGLLGAWDYYVRLDGYRDNEAMCVAADEIEPLP